MYRQNLSSPNSDELTKNRSIATRLPPRSSPVSDAPLKGVYTLNNRGHDTSETGADERDNHS